jgi:hypothetical protein
MALKFNLLKAFISSENIVWNLQISKIVGRDNSVGIATRYGLDGSGIESH